MKKILSFTVTFVFFLSLNAQTNDYLYTGRYLGTDLSTATQLVCSGDLNTIGVPNGMFLSSRNNGGTLELNKLYEFPLDDRSNKKGYTVLLSVSPASPGDGELNQNKLKRIYPNCNIGYKARNFGNSLTTARNYFCSNNPSEQGFEIEFNVIPGANEGELVEGSLYRRNDNGRINYVYITAKNSSPFRDRDSYSENSISQITVSCPDSDNDGIPDFQDNCPNNSNANQADLDNDGIGDTCDSQDNRDTDGDGVENYEDDCPNQAGSVQNNGCPGDPELIFDLDDSIIASDCLNCNTIFSSIGSDRHYVNYVTGKANITVLVENSGESSSIGSDIAFYISQDATYQDTDTRIKTFTLGTINPGGDRQVSGDLLYSDFQSVTGNFWLLIRIDDLERNDEPDETNNVFALRFNVRDN